MNLSNIKPKIRNKNVKRVGRGTGSGRGKTSGRGNKGAGQRAGKKSPYAGYIGGNIPYFRKIPKRGFKPPAAVRKQFQIVNLKDIAGRIKDAASIDPIVLKKYNLIEDETKPVKILAGIKGNFSLKAAFKADRFSGNAKKIIEDKGGKTELLNRIKKPNRGKMKNAKKKDTQT